MRPVVCAEEGCVWVTGGDVGGEDTGGRVEESSCGSSADGNFDCVAEGFAGVTRAGAGGGEEIAGCAEEPFCASFGCTVGWMTSWCVEALLSCVGESSLSWES